jgi:hypothetical protein
MVESNFLLFNGTGNKYYICSRSWKNIVSDATAVLKYLVGSTATIPSVGTIDYLRIQRILKMNPIHLEFGKGEVVLPNTFIEALFLLLVLHKLIKASTMFLVPKN